MKPDIELPPGHVWNENSECIDNVEYDENVAWVEERFGGGWEAVYAPVGVKALFARRIVATEQEGWELLVAWLLLGMNVDDVR